MLNGRNNIRSPAILGCQRSHPISAAAAATKSYISNAFGGAATWGRVAPERLEKAEHFDARWRPPARMVPRRMANGTRQEHGRRRSSEKITTLPFIGARSC